MSTCWVKDTGPYPSMNIDGRRNVKMHRFAWEWLHGPIPPGFVVHHLCRNKRCVNPDHMEAMPEGEHLREHGQIYEAYRVSALARRGATHCKYGHEFTPENTIWQDRERGWRRCRQCHRRVNLESWRKRHSLA